MIIFLEARDDVLIRRFSETRHRHPLGGRARHRVVDRHSSGRCSSPSAQQADVIVDTSDLALRELRERIFARLGDVQRSDRLAIQLISFGFKYGVPLEADLVLDVRFMKNPHYVEALRPNSGLTAEVREYVLGQPIAERFLDALAGAAGPARAGVRRGGQDAAHDRDRVHRKASHRSIVVSEELAAWLRERDVGPVAVFHRELER